MSNLENLVSIGDQFDRLGEYQLADRIDSIIKLAAKVQLNFEGNPHDRPYSKEEEQRLLTVLFEHVIDLYFDIMPKIEYLVPFWDALRSTFETARLKTQENIKDKTKAFDFEAYKKWIRSLTETKHKLEEWRTKPLSSARVTQERALLLSPMQRLIAKLETLFSDDQSLEVILQEWKHVLSVFDNIFGQTTEQIAGVDFKRNI